MSKSCSLQASTNSGVGHDAREGDKTLTKPHPFSSGGDRSWFPGNNDAVMNAWFKCWLIYILFQQHQTGAKGDLGAKVVTAAGVT